MSDERDDIKLDEVRGIESGKRSDNTAGILKEKRVLSEPLSDVEARKRMTGYSRRGFITGGAAALIAVFGWRCMPDETKANLLRRSLEFDERVAQVFYRPTRLAPEFAPESVSAPRTNGMEGLEGEFDPASWRLSVGGLAGRNDDLVLTLDDIKKLPVTYMVTELKCIEGWSIIVEWAGVRFSDFMKAYAPKTINGTAPDVVNRPTELVPYVSLATPDQKYFVGWDMPSILHPQTLLAYEMNGRPLTPDHGAPLRIASPTKYGIKQLKRIGRIEFTAERPRDFWAEQGYDWYSGH
ncbi:MAG: molybdopterin-dependent oxidoreductase [Acidobacteria bacterium]|nr:molybdopterin-dependent oxidoreductase [Acidobacteriota bacterium]